MATMRQSGGLGLLAVLFLTFCLAGPLRAQVAPGGQDGPEPILRLAIHDVKVQGEYSAETVREAFTHILPAVVDCVQAEYQRAGKGPSRLTLRFNLSSNGRVVWSKLVDPAWRALDACLGKALGQMRLGPSGATLSRVTMVLETQQDHLLNP